jgi:hypothetical protein
MGFPLYEKRKKLTTGTPRAQRGKRLPEDPEI